MGALDLKAMRRPSSWHEYVALLFAAVITLLTFGKECCRQHEEGAEMPQVANNAASKLAASVGPSDTEISLQAGTGADFPSAVGDWFPITIIKPNGEFEIARCTARNSDVLTITRAQEGTAAKTFSAGDRVELRLTAGTLEALIAQAVPFTPVEQGGGIDQLPVKVQIGWSGTVLKATVNGVDYGTLWGGSNFDPATKFNVSGGTFTGPVSSAAMNSAMATSDANASLQVQNGGGTGDAGMAMMSFVCSGSYGLKMGLRADGYFGLGGWSAGTWRWYLNAATGDMVAAGNVGAYSDPRLKDDVQRISGALALVEKLDGVRFTWNSRSDLIGQPGARDIGVLADQVEAVLPEIVGRSMPDAKNGGEQWRVVAYNKLVPVLIEAVKELAGRVRQLEGC